MNEAADTSKNTPVDEETRLPESELPSEEEFEAMMQNEAASNDSPDLLAGVQEKLRQRSGGKFYRDRFSTVSSTHTLLWLTLCVIGGAAALFFLLG